MITWLYNHILRELGSPNPAVSFTWGCCRSLSGKAVARQRRALFEETFVKSKRKLGHGQFGLLRDAPMLGPSVQLPLQLGKNTCFGRKKKQKWKCFFKKTQSSVQRGRRPLRVPLLSQISTRPVPVLCYFCNTNTLELYQNKMCKIAQEGSPNEFLRTFFGRFLDALVTGEYL